MNRSHPIFRFFQSDLGSGIGRGVLIGAVVAAIALPLTGIANLHRKAVRSPVATQAQPAARFADLHGEEASDAVRRIADWVADSRDNQRMNFVILDKLNTKAFVFDADARLIGASPVLMGVQPGDDSVVGIGKRPISEVKESERTTAAGRFVAQPGRNATGEDVVWVDYDAAMSMHRVRIVDPKERRLERLASPTTADNRISYGCINMPVAFFEGVVQPAFHKRYGIVYVLPEQKTLEQVFTKAYDVAARHGVPPPHREVASAG